MGQNRDSETRGKSTKICVFSEYIYKWLYLFMCFGRILLFLYFNRTGWRQSGRCMVPGGGPGCRQRPAHGALLNEGGHFTTTPLGILTLILFLSSPRAPVSLSPPLSVSCLSFISFFMCLWIRTLPVTALLLKSSWTRGRELESTPPPHVGGGGGAGHTCWPNQISACTVSHVDKSISVQMKWRNPPLICSKVNWRRFWRTKWNSNSFDERKKKKSNYRESKIMANKWGRNKGLTESHIVYETE